MTIVSGKCQNHTFSRSTNIEKSYKQLGSNIGKSWKQKGSSLVQSLLGGSLSNRLFMVNISGTKVDLPTFLCTNRVSVLIRRGTLSADVDV